MPTDLSQFLDVASLESRLPDLRRRYAAATPFPHTVIDDILPDDVFMAAVAEFPLIDDPRWKGYLHVNETKFGNEQPDTWGPTLVAVAQALTSDRFVRFLDALTGHRDLHADLTMDGGGLHQTLTGGHLNVHADFTTHHRQHRWCRRVNVLLYLNETWLPEWGGDLELWDSDMRSLRSTIAPSGNRMVVFTTPARPFTVIPIPLRCPSSVARRSLALYYFTVEDQPVARATNYRQRPGDGWKRLGIAADRAALGVYDKLKRRLGWSDDAVGAVLRRIHFRGRPRP